MSSASLTGELGEDFASKCETEKGFENFAFDILDSLSIASLNFDELPLNEVQSYSKEAEAQRLESTAADDDVISKIVTFLGDTPGQISLHSSNQGLSSIESEDSNQNIEEGQNSTQSLNEEPSEKGFQFVQFKLRQLVQSFGFRLTALIVIICDICTVMIDIVVTFHSWAQGVEKNYAEYYDVIDVTLSTIFVIELGIRVAALGWIPFFKVWQNALDTVVVIVSFILSIADMAVDENVSTALKILIVLRVVRIVRIVRLYTEKKRLEKAARYLVSQNKRRFQHDGFDLDLTYVTDRVIAMSFPSSGKMSLYRNPIKEVSRFLETKHGGHYKVYNLCSERSYEPSNFQHRVERFHLDDHNVPMVSEMIAFCQSVRRWLESHPKNVVAVHCKGGKGRTGTMICIWLVEAGLFTRAADSLDYFGARRTDRRAGRRFQGVETPSQSRYVGYYERIKTSDGLIRLDQPLKLVRLRLSGLKSVGRGNGQDFRFNLNLGRNPPCFAVDFGKNLNCQTYYVAESDVLEVIVVACPVLNGDTRLVFSCDSKNVPRGCEDSAFYVWFHTAMVSHCYVSFKREELDNPHKAKTWRVYKPEFQLELFFQEVIPNSPEMSYL